MSNYHVVKHKNASKWQAKKAGSKRAGGLYDTQAEAEKAAKNFAANSGGGEVRIHRPTGVIRDSDTVSPGNDPRLSKDTKF